VKKRVTLTFPRRYVQMPVTYRLAKDFNVAANIIRAQVAPNQIGKLVVELSGDIDALDRLDANPRHQRFLRQSRNFH
jgi:L-aspartate semialdehyde sulfurtransferase ferredoxin